MNQKKDKEELLKIRRKIHDNIDELNEFLDLEVNNIKWNKENLLSYLRNNERYLMSVAMIADLINKLNNIQTAHNYKTHCIMQSFIESEETDIKNLISSELNKENANLFAKNKELIDRNSRLINDNNYMKKYKNNYLEDGSSKLALENERLSNELTQANFENAKLQRENNTYSALKCAVKSLK